MTVTTDSTAAAATTAVLMEPARGRGLAAKISTEELADELMERAKADGVSLVGPDGMLAGLTKRVLESMLEAEMTEHVGYEAHDPAGHNSGNSRNGATTKTLKGDFGEVPLETPRDRNGSYEPKIIGKGQTRFTGFDDKIISMYARGMSTREIQGHLEE